MCQGRNSRRAAVNDIGYGRGLAVRYGRPLRADPRASDARANRGRGAAAAEAVHEAAHAPPARDGAPPLTSCLSDGIMDAEISRAVWRPARLETDVDCRRPS